MNHSKTAIVTGGAGFIGSNLCDALLGRGLEVIAVDNLITGREENLESAKKSGAFTFLKQDVCGNIPLGKHIDFVYHLASPASVPDYQSHPLETAHVNTIGTENMLKIARDNNARFLFSSTSEVYGDPKEHPQKESYWGNVNPVGQRSCYDEAKRFGETLTVIYHLKHSVDARIVRIFNTYGPRMRKNDGRVVSNFINQALSGIPMTIYGDGTQTRSICYVDDMVEGIIAAMERDNTNGEVINLGKPSEFTVKDLAEKIKTMTDSRSDFTNLPLPSDDPKERRPDITKAKDLLNWEPKITVEDGLKKTIEYYKTI